MAREGATLSADRTESTSLARRSHRAFLRPGTRIAGSSERSRHAQRAARRPDLAQVRRQAKELLRAARGGDEAAVAQIRGVSGELAPASAQLAIARAHGFASWARLVTEIERREILTARDESRLAELLAGDPALAARSLEQWCDHPKGVRPLQFIAMLRFDAERLGIAGELPRTGAIARALLAAGAPVDGEPGDRETPLITAASYGDADVAQALIEAGADVDAVAPPDAGGIPGGTPLLHAAVFGMTAVLDVLVAAGARIDGIEVAAAAGDLGGRLTPDTDPEARIRALVMAADHERLGVIDELLAAGTPIDATDAVFGRQALRHRAGERPQREHRASADTRRGPPGCFLVCLRLMLATPGNG